MSCPSHVDVFIVGGGPVGLTIGYALQRMKVTTAIVELLDKENMPMYGRACSLYPRTVEMIDQLGLSDDFTQVGFIARANVNYKNGKVVTSRGWGAMFSNISSSYHDYVLNIRVKNSEDLLRAAYIREGGVYMPKWELADLRVDLAESQGYKVTTTIRAVGSDESKTIQSKFLVGADGGHSKVRHLSGIESDSSSTEYQWVRIDGVIKTDMPDSELGFASLESPTHGNVLYVNLDGPRGSVRIGYAVHKGHYAKDGGKITEAQAIEGAKAAMAPFNVEFEKVDWYTLYSIHESVAKQYIKDDCIILAGDACHTHSSGTAQGMNTGVHDAVNLAWKLGGSLRGFYKSEIVKTYESERQPIAQHVINLDKEISALISGKIPEQYATFSNDPDTVLAKVTSDAIDFNSGLGIHYNESSLINRPFLAGVHGAGWRAPDTLLQVPGSRVPVRLQQITPNVGAYWILVFAGEPLLTKGKLQALRSYVDSNQNFAKRMHPDALRFLTIIRGVKPQGHQALGVQSFGKFYYDADGEAHGRYRMSDENGGIVIVRPDGILAFATHFEEIEEVNDYFDQVAVMHQ